MERAKPRYRRKLTSHIMAPKPLPYSPSKITDEEWEELVRKVKRDRGV